MKTRISIIAVALTLSACAQTFDYVKPDGTPVTQLGQYGSTVWTSSGRPVLSGSATSIPAGQPGDGGAADGGSE